MKRALIFGVSGQDGAYLSEFLIKKGYTVFGTSRFPSDIRMKNLDALGISAQVQYLAADPAEFRSVLYAIDKTKPHEIYNLSGQTSVALSFKTPVETMSSIIIATQNILEAVRYVNLDMKLYNACSTEIFGGIEGVVDEETPFRPISPYGISKAAAYWLTSNYRKNYGIYACSGILSNHESPLRPDVFVTKKIINYVRLLECSGYPGYKLQLQNLGVMRDWGWAAEYVIAMWKMLQADTPQDYLVATGQSYSLRQFVEYAFNSIGHEYYDFVEAKTEDIRPADVTCSRMNISRSKDELGWDPKVNMYGVIDRLMANQLI